MKQEKIHFEIETVQWGGGIFLLDEEDKKWKLSSKYARAKVKENPSLLNKYIVIEREILTPVRSAFHGMARDQLLLLEPDYLRIVKELKPSIYKALRKRRRMLAGGKRESQV
ncbi:hypothetical protein D6764_04695 [Candidatus Woesearchaeota archaeon]|nr:MAG: hypothetical protein D6764_04695 [Candidatus Woesearchaeota archaeon]